MPKKFTQDEFVSRANIVHGNKYDYSKVVYNGSKSKITIICPHHGEYTKVASAHLGGCGCSFCSGYRYTTDTFIDKALLVHKGKYKYTKVIYQGTYVHVTIICPTHGEFKQPPNDHLAGAGCPMCGKSQRLDANIFSKRSNIVHKGVYDYEKVIYENNHKKVIIVCPTHGEFKQAPSRHMDGQ